MLHFFGQRNFNRIITEKGETHWQQEWNASTKGETTNSKKVRHVCAEWAPRLQVT